MQAFTVRFADEEGDLLRAQAAERRMSVARLIKERALTGTGRVGEDVTPVREPGSSPPVPASACPMYVPRGTKCKSCGQVHK